MDRKEFYGSIQWKNCRDAYRKQAGGLCERCLAKGLYVPGEIVHHKIHLNEKNLNDTKIALNPDNLQLVCRQCHTEIHSGRRWRVDENGRVIERK